VTTSSSSRTLLSAKDQDPARSLRESSPKLKYYHYSPDGSGDHLSLSEDTKRFQREREAKPKSIAVSDFDQVTGATVDGVNKKVSFVHYEVKDDVHISGSLRAGKLFEGQGVVGIAKEYERVMAQYDVSFVKESPYNLAFIDFGANIGMYTVGISSIALDRVPLTVFAFEPMDRNLALLSASLRLNELSNVYLFPYGVTEFAKLGDTEKVVVGSVNKGGTGVVLDFDENDEDKDSKAVIKEIETLCLDEVTQMLKDQFPELYGNWINAVWIKMDIESLEPSAIRGGGNSLFSNSTMDPCYVHIEFTSNQKEIQSVLEAVGYERISADSISMPPTPQDTLFAKQDAEECLLRKTTKIKQLRAQSNTLKDSVDGSFEGLSFTHKSESESGVKSFGVFSGYWGWSVIAVLFAIAAGLVYSVYCAKVYPAVFYQYCLKGMRPKQH